MSEEKENRDYDHKPSVRGFTSEYNVSSEENPKPTSGQEPFSCMVNDHMCPANGYWWSFNRIQQWRI